MKLLFKALTILIFCWGSSFSFATEEPFESTIKILCGIDEKGKDICLDQNGNFVPVPESKPKFKDSI
ncbi:hypothetical protein [Arsenophonus nasoniae]|uniref:hypothetical protein n=1 Tax=Arsenophonus nasoniae TaxID=638 RepID=UPI0038793801